MHNQFYRAQPSVVHQIACTCPTAMSLPSSSVATEEVVCVLSLRSRSHPVTGRRMSQLDSAQESLEEVQSCWHTTLHVQALIGYCSTCQAEPLTASVELRQLCILPVLPANVGGQFLAGTASLRLAIVEVPAVRVHICASSPASVSCRVQHSICCSLIANLAWPRVGSVASMYTVANLQPWQGWQNWFDDVPL